VNLYQRLLKAHELVVLAVKEPPERRQLHVVLLESPVRK